MCHKYFPEVRVNVCNVSTVCAVQTVFTVCTVRVKCVVSEHLDEDQEAIHEKGIRETFNLERVSVAQRFVLGSYKLEFDKECSCWS